MDDSRLSKLFYSKSSDPLTVAKYLIRKNDRRVVDKVLNLVESNNSKVKYRSIKTLNHISKLKPSLLYENWDYFVEKLDSDNNILKWNSIEIIANMVKIDKDDKFIQIFNKYFDLIKNDTGITVYFVIENAASIINSKPELREQIIDLLIDVDKLNNLDQKNLDFLTGKTITTFQECFSHVESNDQVVEFVSKQKNSRRRLNRSKANKFLETYST